MYKRYFFVAALILAAFTELSAEEDFVQNDYYVALSEETGVGDVALDEYVIVKDIKRESDNIFGQPVSGTSVKSAELENRKTNSLKELSAVVPNFHIPDYGSKTTSSVYVRGLGSRIDQPVVGLYLNGVPCMNKSMFDFDFYELRSVEVLRGPQSTLYGRNTMAGIVSVMTKDAFNPLTNAYLSYGSYNDMKLRLSHYNHVGKVGFSVGGYFNQNDGFFKNEYTGKKADEGKSYGGRIGLNWKKGDFYLNYTGNLDVVDQGGYPYVMYSEGKPGSVNYNDPCGYDRVIVSNGLFLKYNTDKVQFSSATGYQFLDDEMVLDQDFSPRSIFAMTQAQHENSLTEEFVIKPYNSQSDYKWLFGAFGFYKGLEVAAPVTFKKDGISSLIESGVNNVEYLSNMGMALDILNDNLLIDSEFEYPTFGAALFHQSEINNLFTDGLTLTLGVRLDYEKASLDYNCRADVNYIFTPMLTDARDIVTMVNGSEDKSFWQVLPKVALKYDFNEKNNVYLSVAKGYKAGGFNTQMFADIMQSQMRVDIKKDLYDQIPDRLTQVKETLAPILLEKVNYDMKEVISYDPEYSWNYEIGSHLSFIDNKLQADLALFYIDCKEQQLTVFAESGLGRKMANAGRTESYGVESAVRANICKGLWLDAAYGYTHASFKEYFNGKVDLSGKYVPFAPQNTFSAGLEYELNINRKLLDRILFNVNYAGVGKIYWTEDNSKSQDFYGLLSGGVSFQKKGVKLGVWAKNLTDEDYSTFYFESLGNGFMQKGKPLQIGADLKWTF